MPILHDIIDERIETILIENNDLNSFKFADKVIEIFQ